MGGDDAALGLLDNRHPDRAEMGGSSNIHERWGSGMNDWREELIEQMAKAAWECDTLRKWEDISKWMQEGVRRDCRAALAVAEPVIREQCAEDAAAVAKEHLTDAVAAIVAAAIREGGKDA